MVNLNHLELEHFENKEDEYYTGYDLTYNELREATQITRSLESLSVFARSTDMNENKRFYDMFPNLKRLKFHLPINKNSELFHCINERCINVESLYIRFLNCGSEIYFPKLKELSVCEFYNEKHLFSFI